MQNLTKRYEELNPQDNELEWGRCSQCEERMPVVCFSSDRPGVCRQCAYPDNLKHLAGVANMAAVVRAVEAVRSRRHRAAMMAVSHAYFMEDKPRKNTSSVSFIVGGGTPCPTP